MKIKIGIAFSLLIASLFLSSCASRTPHIQVTTPPLKKKTLELMGYTIQAGAFANVSNAVRLTNLLRERGLDSTYFKASDGLYKVRFGNYSTKEAATRAAQSLVSRGTIKEYYIVLPEDYAVARQKQLGEDYLREALVKTAHDFIGVPYLWGGTSADKGFDCSGLTMTVYQLNGLNLPRTSAMQFEGGTPINRTRNLKKGDLVFFALKQRNRVSHVGIYIGDSYFIHASSQGQEIRIDSLDTSYYSNGYMGGRTYL
ncbi:MAG TPA: hydrolase [Deltaproteobacteria bacterium]|nr:hydrolase [Deltaproteobacteria bacterium]